jgi:hypothetical protein
MIFGEVKVKEDARRRKRWNKLWIPIQDLEKKPLDFWTIILF